MYLIRYKKVRRGSKVRPKEPVRRDLSPQREYTVEGVQRHVCWDHEGHDPFGKDLLRHPLRCEGCGNLIDSQYITLEGQKGRFSSEDFDLQRTVSSPDRSLKVIFQRLMKRKGAAV